MEVRHEFRRYPGPVGVLLLGLALVVAAGRQRWL